MKVEGPLHVVCQCDKCQAKPAPVQMEPLGYIASMAANDLLASIYRDVTVYGEDLEDTVAIYTTPPQRTWVGLTEEERLFLHGRDSELDDLISVIEAKLRSKNI
jgi:hypothetical protein